MLSKELLQLLAMNYSLLLLCDSLCGIDIYKPVLCLSFYFVMWIYFLLCWNLSILVETPNQTMWINSLVVARQNVPITFIDSETTLS